MLYSIVPPILIILSLAGIILFLMKKSPKIVKLEEMDLQKEKSQRYPAKEDGFLARSWKKIKNIRWSEIRHALLILLEKITRRFRIIFLKLEAACSNWSSSIKSRRGKKDALPPESVPKAEDSVIKKLEAYKIRKKKEALSAEENESRPADEAEEKIIKPMVSDKIVVPQSRAEIKDKLEELLIERIAANPKDVEAYERLGEYYWEIKSFDFSKECFKQVVKLDPSNGSARYKLRRMENLLRER